MIHRLRLFLTLLLVLNLLINSSYLYAEKALNTATGIYQHVVQQDLDVAYEALKQALEEKKFFVVLEPDMGARMAKFADSWGADYNRNQLEAIRSMVFCNIWQTNQLANADPALLALCPLHLTLIHKQGQTTVLLPSLQRLAEGSPGVKVVQALEQALLQIIEQALPAAQPALKK